MKLYCSLCSAFAVAVLVGAASAQVSIWNFTLDGPSESPPNASPGTGVATITYNATLRTLRLQTSFSGLLGTTTAAHIHASSTMAPFSGTAGVASQTPSFVGFPLGVSSGSYDNTFDLSLASSWNGSYITANGGTTLTAEAALINQMNQGRAYLNIHSSVFGGGEIRGFTPTPGAAGLLGLGALAACRRRR